MATVDLTRLTPQHPYAQQHSRDRVRVVTATYDAVAHNGAAADVMKLIDVPADSLLLAVRVEVETPEGAALTFDVGDSAAPAGFHSNVNGNAVGEAVYSTPKYYATADTLNLVTDAAASHALIHVVAAFIELSSKY